MVYWALLDGDWDKRRLIDLDFPNQSYSHCSGLGFVASNRLVLQCIVTGAIFRLSFVVSGI